MRISREEAHAMNAAGKKMLVVRAGAAWLFCPYLPNATYHSVHWIHEQKRSVQCEGPNCAHHHFPVNRKAHIPCLVRSKPISLAHVSALQYPQDLHFNGGEWQAKVIELTGNCFKTLEAASKPDQLAIAWRPGEQRNGPMHFRWVVGILKNVPASLACMRIEDVLPAVIHGEYRDARIEVPLDNSAGSRIKHNLPYQTRDSADGRNPTDGGVDGPHPGESNHKCIDGPFRELSHSEKVFRTDGIHGRDWHEEDASCDGI